MKAQQAPACAASHIEVDWPAIHWQTVTQNVRRLQARIVKATQEGRWGKVKALQRLLPRSFSGKALAVRRVTENQGKCTPGVDGEIWDTPAKKASAVSALRQRGYTRQPARRIYIPKRNGKQPDPARPRDAGARPVSARPDSRSPGRRELLWLSERPFYR